jgi:hypothetical protein
MLVDSLEVNARVRPDVVVLDEAQRIKNWSAKTTQAIKRLRSRYAFILTGTPVENRIDELHSLMDFLEPSVLGPLFRFNREFYQLDDRGAGGLDDEARAPLLEAALAISRALAAETRLPEPSALDDALMPPLSHHWHDALPLLRGFATDPSQSWQPIAESIEKQLAR